MIKTAEFVTSVASYKNLYVSDYPEIAFVGRSNVGKSSLINLITNQKKLAKTSSTPGRTRLVNYFLINKELLLVDLPGYGYAQASKDTQESWGELLENYLKSSKNLKAVYLLLDVRHLPTEQDKQMVKFLYFYNIPIIFVLTKCDKLSRAQYNKSSQDIANSLGITKANMIFTSSDSRQGKDDLIESILSKAKL